MLTQAELKSYLHYNPETGIFTWLHTRSNRALKGNSAGTISHRGYIHISINGKAYQAHRLAWLYVYGEFPKNDIDHINMVKDDNRIANLRNVSRAENSRNRKISTKNSSGFPGVSFSKIKNRFIAKISIENKLKYLGSAKSAEEAFEYYRKFHNEHYGYLKSW